MRWFISDFRSLSDLIAREVALTHILFSPNYRWLLLPILLLFNVIATSAFAENIGGNPTPLERRELPVPGETAPVLPKINLHYRLHLKLRSRSLFFKEIKFLVPKN